MRLWCLRSAAHRPGHGPAQGGTDDGAGADIARSTKKTFAYLRAFLSVTELGGDDATGSDALYEIKVVSPHLKKLSLDLKHGGELGRSHTRDELRKQMTLAMLARHANSSGASSSSSTTLVATGA